MNKEIGRIFVEAKKELEMSREELLNKLWDVQQENERLKEIEKEHQKINGELREVIKEVEQFSKDVLEEYETSLTEDGEHIYFFPPYVTEILEILNKSK